MTELFLTMIFSGMVFGLVGFFVGLWCCEPTEEIMLSDKEIDRLLSNKKKKRKK